MSAHPKVERKQLAGGSLICDLADPEGLGELQVAIRNQSLRSKFDFVCVRERDPNTLEAAENS